MIVASWRPHLFGLAAAAVLVLPVEAALAAAEAPETIDPAASCADGGCHAEITEHRNLHWSDFAAGGECAKCHESEGNLHEFTVGDAPEICTACHEEVAQSIRSSKRVHEPAEDCLDCHDAHGGKVKSMLLDVSREENLKPLCFTCHDEDILEQKFTHGPVDQGSCGECHEPHTASRRYLLRAEAGVDLCGGCHEEIADEIAAAKYVHEPVTGGCTDCHDPHSSPHPNLLLAEKRLLCDECHDEIVLLAEESPVHHTATTTRDECLNCHAPHASNHAPNLKKPERELCLGCHDERIRVGDSVLIDMKRWMSDHDVWHEPIREDGCVGCHQPHGSENFRLLEKAFPSSFYASFELRSYKLCFSCHEERLVMSKRSRTATGFRDGDRNLHYLHVNRQKKGRSCRACHDMHASTQPFQLRERVKFGRWLMPLNFKKTETGGSCSTGCHKLRVYDREAASGRGQR